MDLFRALATRRSAPVFEDPAPPRATIERIIEAATWAPNHRHTEPWRFTVLAGAARHELGERVAAWMRETLDPAIADKQATSTQQKLLRSPVIIIVAQKGAPDDATRHLEDYAACAAATQNLLLAAHAEGFAAKWSTGALATAPPVFAYLGLAPEDRVVAFIYVGQRPEGADGRPPQRNPAAVDWRGFQD